MNKYLVSLSKKASRELDEIYRFIALDNPHEALKHINIILDKIDNLRTFPNLGEKISRFYSQKHNIRVLLVDNVRVIYIVSAKINAIQVIHILKDSRNLDRVLLSDDMNKTIQGDFSRKNRSN